MAAQHGTRSRYIHQKCRCDSCRTANTEYLRKFDRKISATPIIHGTANGHRRGCRCEACCAAKQTQDRAYYLANREQVLEINRRWAEENRDALRIHLAAKYSANREREAEKRRQAYRANPGPYKDRALTRRQKVRGVAVEFVERDVVWERDAGICHICSQPADVNDWHLDHIIALDLGGEHSYANVAVSHPRCNREKWNKPWPR